MNDTNDSVSQRILQTLYSIPKGSVTTYGQVASLSGEPGKARYVGYLLKNLPNGSTIPWHRVVNSQGKISFPADTEAYREQKQRLLAEGILFTNGKIPLSKYSWTP